MSNRHKAAYCRDVIIGFTCFIVLVAVFQLLKWMDSSCTTSDAALNLLALIIPATALVADAHFRIKATRILRKQRMNKK